MSTPSLLEKIKLDRFYQIGVILSFLIFITSISVEVKFLNNAILSLFSLSFLFFFLGVWMSMGKRFERSQGIMFSYAILKKTKFGMTFYLISLTLFILGLLNLYKFLN